MSTISPAVATLTWRSQAKLQGLPHHASVGLENAEVRGLSEPASRERRRPTVLARSIGQHMRGFSLLALILGAVYPRPAWASTAGGAPALPSLAAFISSVQNGRGLQLRGVYAEGLFALPVAQQPSSESEFVAKADHVLTQFMAAASFGNVGLLAHNYLSGQYFFRLQQGQRIDLVYGDGHVVTYLVVHQFEYQAEDPLSATSDFIDLTNGIQLSADDLFREVYMGPPHVTFQTCISRDGKSSWGRLFVMAEPSARRLVGLRN